MKIGAANAEHQYFDQGQKPHSKNQQMTSMRTGSVHEFTLSFKAGYQITLE
jgi:hypothetical protein